MHKRHASGIAAGITALVLVAAACGSSKGSQATSPTSTTPATAAPAGTPTTAAAGSQWTTSHPFKAAFIYVGAPSDAGWTHAHDVGRQEVQSYFGGRVVTEYKENIPEGPQVAQVITQLINDGNNIIYATSFGYQDAMAAAAKAHPNVLFEQSTGTDLSANLAEYYGAGEDGDYLSGMAAGFASKTGKIGFVAPVCDPRGHPGDRRVHHGRPLGESQRHGEGGLDQYLVRSGHGTVRC